MLLRLEILFDRFSDAMGWIYRIAMNEARELFRRRKRKPAVSLDNIPVDFDEQSHPIGISDDLRNNTIRKYDIYISD